MKKLLFLTLALLSSNVFCNKFHPLNYYKEKLEKFEQERVVRPKSTSNEGVVVTKAMPAVVTEVAPEVVAVKAAPAVVAAATPSDDAVAKFKQENPLAAELILTCMRRNKFIIKNNEVTLALKGLDITLLRDWDSSYGQTKVVFSDDRCVGIDADQEVTLYSKILAAVEMKKANSYGDYFKVELACKCRDLKKNYECVFSVPKDIALAMQKEVAKNK